MLIVRESKELTSGKYEVYGQRTQKIFFMGTFESCQNFIKARHIQIKKTKRNQQKREENQMLSDLCGTSAKSARLDMGLSKY